MFAKPNEIEFSVKDERSHPRPALGAGNDHAVDGCIHHTRTCANCLGDLGRRDVLAFPPERVADAIDEIEISTTVSLHQIAGTEPGVAISKDVPKDLFLRIFRARIAFEPATGARAIIDNSAK